MKNLITRTVADRIKTRFDDQKAIVIQGARQVGKTTLINQLISTDRQVLWVNGDDPRDRSLWANASKALIHDLIEGYDFLIIDEAQRIENVGLSIKMIIDGDEDVKVILSGSPSLDLASTLSEPLTGRKWTFNLFPLSWQEIVGKYRLSTALSQLDSLLIYGAYPEIVTNPGDRQDRLVEIMDSYLYKDVLEYGDIRKPELIVKLLRALSYQVGSEVSYQELSILLGVDRKTILRYVQLLEDAYVIYRLPPLSTNPRKEISTSRKIYFYDNGIRNAIIGNLTPLNARSDQDQLWENFIVTEMLKHQRNENKLGDFYFWRNRDRAEVDLVFSSGGTYQAFEIKYNPRKKVKFPKAFLERYEPVEKTVINRENFYAVFK